jgi:2,4-dienoyl-CoA reductase-like NADH-dependent reductase (Old Yellow Enzyme family)/thioredoxin reductase
LQLGNITLPNRVVMAPMSTNLGGLDGSVSDQQIAFYRARAEGGTGMIIVEFCSVQRSTGRSEERQLSLESEDFLDGHKRLVEVITNAGSVACLQLQHGGPGIKRSLVESGIAVGPSDVVSRRDPNKLTARALTHEEIETLIECFGQTAELAIKAGYQAIELHGAHGYLITAFLSPFMNHRDDQWGGDMERRLNFPRRIIERVKQAIGDRPLSFRLSADEFTPKGNSPEDMVEIARRLEQFGVDALHVSIGLGATSFDKIIEPMSMPEGWRLPYAKAIKAAVNVPVISVGQIRWPAVAEQAIADGSCDLIALGRPLLADPEWANHVKRNEPITPCTSCNYCTTLSDSALGHIGCAENPLTGRELLPPLDAGALRGQTAVIVGGGPGGMAAALLLEQAGFKTHLYEARNALGGGLIASAAPPFKEKLNWYKDFLIDQLAQSNVQVAIRTPADVEQIKILKPAIVMLANGGRPNDLAIEGDQHPAVCDAYELLMGEDFNDAINNEKEMLVYGGGETGCECAEYLAERGHRVVLVSRSPAAKLARSAEMIYRGVLLKRLNDNPLIRLLDNAHLDRIDENGAAQVRRNPNDEQPETTDVIATNKIFIAQGRKPDATLATQLTQADIRCVSIGDARRGGRIGDAVHDAYNTVLELCNAQGDFESTLSST